MSKSKPSLPKGMRDFGPEVAAKRSYITDIIKKHFRKYGFSQLETPSMENLSTLTGKYGEEGDQLLFKVLNSGDYLSKTTEDDFRQGSKPFTAKISEKGLRYDLTVPFARFVVMNQHQIAFPFKRFQVQPVWRADRPQKGRYREFYQCDADVIGSKSLWNEAELTLLITDVFSDLGLENYIIKVNHRDILFKLAAHVGLEGREIPFCAEIDKLDKIGEEKVMENVRSLGSNEKIEEVLDLFKEKDRGTNIDRIVKLMGENKGINDVQTYFNNLSPFESKGLKVELDLSLARGLSYYTGIIFEVKPTSVQMGSIVGGGRYDDLTGIFGLNDVSGVGISFGLDRIYDVLEELQLFPNQVSQHIEILCVHFGEDSKKHGQLVVMELRDAGINAELFPDSVKIQKQFNYADKISVPYVLVIGEEEMKTQRYSLKNMQSGTQEKLGLEAVIAKF